MRSMLHRLALCLSCASGTQAVAEETDDRDLFNLWTKCATLDLVIAELDEEETAFGLTANRIETLVRSRLRAARIYDSDKFEYLFVEVVVVGEAFLVHFDFNKVLDDRRTGLVRLAPTWAYSVLGTHGRSDDYILAGVSEVADQFVDEYLRVNAASCGRGSTLEPVDFNPFPDRGK